MSEAIQMKDVAEKVRSGERLNQEEGLYLLEEAPILELGALAQEVRFRHNPKQVVTFVVDTNLNYTNVCDAYCTFCAFYRTEKDDDAYTHSVEQVMEMVGQAASKGVTTVLLQGGLNPKLPMEYYEELVRETRARYPQVLPHFFSAPEIQKMSQVSETPISEVLQSPEGRRPGDTPGRRLRGSFGLGQAPAQPPMAQGHGAGLGRRAPGGPQTGLQDNGYHDVRPRGETPGPH